MSVTCIPRVGIETIAIMEGSKIAELGRIITKLLKRKVHLQHSLQFQKLDEAYL